MTLASGRADLVRDDVLDAQSDVAWAKVLHLVLPTLDGPSMEKVFARLDLDEMEPGALARRSQDRKGGPGPAGIGRRRG